MGKFKVGDKVKLIMDKTNDNYYIVLREVMYFSHMENKTIINYKCAFKGTESLPSIYHLREVDLEHFIPNNNDNKVEEFKPLTIAVDFDGTLFETNWPDEIIKPIDKVVDWCKKKKEEGHILTLWTCRTGRHLEEAIQACKDIGLEFDYINENTKDKLGLYEFDSRKIGADIYLDDHAMRIEDIED